tara:strand:+ start:1521 stop:3182 length:1662 start_codon:yes stop_codon:yes gene_type:complete
MPTFEITAPNGQTYEVTGDNAEGAYTALISMLGETDSTPAPKATPTEPYVDEQGITRYPNLQQVESGAFEDVVGAGLAGMARGAKGAIETPEMLVKGIGRLRQEADYGFGNVPEDQKINPFETLTGQGIDAALSTFGGDKAMEYKGESRPARVVGTVGEFVGPTGALGLLGKGLKKAGKADNISDALIAAGGTNKALKTAAIAGVGSELAGQATEGTAAEPYARVIGAFATPYALSGAVGIKNKTALAFEKRAAEQTTVETARANKNAKYAAAKAAGAEVDVDMDGFKSYIDDAITNAPEDMFVGYVPGVDTHIDDVLKIIASKRGQTLNISQMEVLRTAIKNKYRTGMGGGQNAYDPRVGYIVDKLDDALETAPTGISGAKADEAFKIARQANSQYRKIELFDDLMRKADLDAGTAGSSASSAMKHRQVIKSILNSPKKRRQFDATELEVMDKFVRGTFPENVMNVLGKFSPTGNGIMAALNAAAVYFNPTLLAASLASMGFKAGAKVSASNQLKALKKMVLTGMPPEKRKLITDKDLTILLGLSSQLPQGQ